MRTPTRETETQVTRIDPATSPARTFSGEVAPGVMQAMLEAVRGESQQDPHAYLEETEVPHGGE